MMHILFASSIIASVYAQFPLKHWTNAADSYTDCHNSGCSRTAAEEHDQNLPAHAPSDLSYTCASGWRETISCFGGPMGQSCTYRCNCNDCGRVCYLDEIINLNECNIESIPVVKNNVALMISESGLDIAIGNIPDAVTKYGWAIAFGKSVFKAVSGQPTVAGVIKDINDRIVKIENCMDQKIAEVTSGEIRDDMQKSFGEYSNAADYIHSDYETCNLRCLIETAFKSFESVARTEFGSDDLVGNDANHYVKLLPETQNFAALFAMSANDWLGILRKEMETNHELYNQQLQKTVDGFENLYRFVQKAHEVIAADLWSKAYQHLPCKNADNLQSDMAHWDRLFHEANTTPVYKYLQTFYNLQKADHTTGVLVAEGQACVHETKNFETVKIVTSPQECALMAMFYPDECRSGRFQMADYSSWGCRCCAEDSELYENEHWKVYKVYTVPSGGHHSAKAVEESSIAMDAPMDSVMTMDEGMEIDDTLYEGEICEWNGKPNIDVVSVNGVYFSFDADVMGTILGQTSWATRLYVVYNERTETEINVRMWMDEDDGPLGRTYPFADAKDGDWEEGDVLRFVYGECEEGLQCKETDREAHTCQVEKDAF